jgi:hypothetical protein
MVGTHKKLVKAIGRRRASKARGEMSDMDKALLTSDELELPLLVKSESDIQAAISATKNRIEHHGMWLDLAKSTLKTMASDPHIRGRSHSDSPAVQSQYGAERDSLEKALRGTDALYSRLHREIAGLRKRSLRACRRREIKETEEMETALVTNAIADRANLAKLRENMKWQMRALKACIAVQPASS